MVRNVTFFAIVLIVAGALIQSAVPAAAQEAGSDTDMMTGDLAPVEEPLRRMEDIWDDISDSIKPSLVLVRTKFDRPRPVTDVFPPALYYGRFGSGFLFKKDGEVGYILTDSRTLSHAEDIQVLFFDGRSYQGEIVGRDSRTDIGVVKIRVRDGAGLVVPQIGNSEECEVGEPMIVTGSTSVFASSPTVTFGIISAIRDTSPSDTKINTIFQTDAPVSAGQNGGPVLNVEGEIIAVSSLRQTYALTGDNLNFVIPINEAIDIAYQLIQSEDGKIPRKWLGWTLIELNDTLRINFEFSHEEGMFVTAVEDGSPAMDAGLRIEDIIYSMNGEVINEYYDQRAVLNDLNIGDSIDIIYYRKLFRGEEERRATLVIKEEESDDDDD